MTKNEFYDRCAVLLGVEYRCSGLPSPFRGRWNNRGPGHGRFPGYGLIRLHGEEVHVSLRHPVSVRRRFDDMRQALDWLSEALADQA